MTAALHSATVNLTSLTKSYKCRTSEGIISASRAWVLGPVAEITRSVKAGSYSGFAFGFGAPLGTAIAGVVLAFLFLSGLWAGKVEISVMGKGPLGRGLSQKGRIEMELSLGAGIGSGCPVIDGRIHEQRGIGYRNMWDGNPVSASVA